MAEAPPLNEIRLELRGGNAEFFGAREREVLLEGPRGTGKTRTVEELLNILCHSYPGLHVLILRKYQKTLASTSLKTLREQVLKPGDRVSYFGGNDIEPACFRYANGSRIFLGGMDDPEKWKSAELDIIYANEVTELTEDEYQSLIPLLRHLKDGAPYIPSQRIISDTNPANSGHWVNKRAERGQMRRIRTRLLDNPAMAMRDGTLTPFGQEYVAGLQQLSGPIRERWLDGTWTGTEDACYPYFDRRIHIRPLEPGLQLTSIIGEDYGSVHTCAVATVSYDQYNRMWVREVTYLKDELVPGQRLSTVDLAVAQHKEKYKVLRGRVDPNQAKLALAHGFKVAKGGTGGAVGAPRLHRIDMMQPRFHTYEGGRIPSFDQYSNLQVPQGPFLEPDSPGFFLVEGAPGIDRLADEIEAYHFIYTETPKGKTKDVYRDAEDGIAAIEYANEEWESAPPADAYHAPRSYSLDYNATPPPARDEYTQIRQLQRRRRQERGEPTRRGSL